MAPLLPVLLLAMVAGLEMREGPHVLRSDDSPPDLLFPLLVQLISRRFNSCYHQILLEGDVSVESGGEAIAGSWSSPGFSSRVADYSGAGPLCRRTVIFLRSFSGMCFLEAKLVTLCAPNIAKISSRLQQVGNYFRDGAYSLPIRWQVHRQREHWHSPISVQGQIVGVLLECNGMESIVLLQVWNLHIVVGVDAPVHFFDRLGVILREALRCFDDVVANEIEAKMVVFGRCCVATMVVIANSGDVVSTKISEFSYGRTIESKEQDSESFCCTMLSLPDGDRVEEAVPLLFGFFHQRWTTTLLLLIPRFNRGDTLRLSSVMVHKYLQLNSPQPQVHTPDRPLGEPTAGHQLVWSTEAFGDCGCSIFESGLSTDDRSLFGSFGNLRFLHVLYRFRPSYTYFVQLGTSVSCSVLESHVMVYCEL